MGSIRFNNPDDLKKISLNLSYLYTLSPIANTQQHDGNTLSVASQPQIYVPNSVQQSFQTNNWKEISNYQSRSNDDLKPLYDYIIKYQTSAWACVEDLIGCYYINMVWDNRGNYVWTSCASVNPTDPDPFNPKVKLIAPVVYGAFSKSTSICGIHSYNLGLVTLASELTCSSIISFFICKLLKKGLNFLAEDLLAFASEAAAEAGIGFLFTATTLVIGAVCSVAVFAIVFIGIIFLFNFLNKRFQISVSVFNWDTTADWQITTQSLSNAINPGESTSNILNLNIGKQLLPGQNPVYGGTIVIPYALQIVLLHTTEVAMNYAFICYENKKTFTQGLSFSIVGTRGNDPNTGFSYAFQCPWTASNAQYMEGTAQDAGSFLNKARSHWSEHTGPFTVYSGLADWPIKAYIDALKGGDADGSDCYKVAIHIAPSNQ